MKRFLPLLLVVLAAAAWPAVSSAHGFKGTVVAKQRGVLLVSTPSGVVHAISGRAAVGARIAMSGSGIRVVGHARSAFVRGTVVRRSSDHAFLEAADHVIAVQGTMPSTAQPGDVVKTQVQIQSDDDLQEVETEEIGHDNSALVSATIAAIQPATATQAGSITLTVNGQSLVVPLAAGTTLPASVAVGQTVQLQLSFASGTAQVGDDDNQSNDNDDQGGNGGSSGGGGDHGGGDHGGGGGGDG